LLKALVYRPASYSAVLPFFLDITMTEEADFPHGKCVQVVCWGLEGQGKVYWVSVLL